MSEVHLCDINGRKGLFMQVTNVMTKDGLKLLKKDKESSSEALNALITSQITFMETTS